MVKGSNLFISVVIPVGNGSIYLSEVLSSLESQTRIPDEVIIVDDRVKDDSLSNISDYKLNVKLVKTTKEMGRYGVSSARNIGAENSSFGVLLFLDTDVLLPDDYIQNLLEVMEDEDGVLGIQSVDCGFKDFYSNYKNLWMRYTYEVLTDEVGLFYTSCASIKRDCFFKAGSFDEEYRIPGVEDTIFGNKLRKHNINIVIEKSLEYIHKKRYSFKTALLTDLVRSKKLTEYFLYSIKEIKSGKTTSIPFSYFFSIPLTFLSILTISLSLINPLFLIIPLIFLITPSILTWKYLDYLRQKRGVFFMIKSLFYQYLVFLMSGSGIICGILYWTFKRQKSK